MIQSRTENGTNQSLSDGSTCCAVHWEINTFAMAIMAPWAAYTPPPLCENRALSSKGLAPCVLTCN
eukprot:686144-Pleurochrysis_carterae.AAC.2